MEAMEVAEKWKIYPPGNDPIINEALGLRLSGIFFYIAGVVFIFMSMLYVYQKYIKNSNNVGNAYNKEKKGAKAFFLLRETVFYIISMVLLFIGSMILGFVIMRLAPGMTPLGPQIDGGIVLTLPFIFWISKLFFPKMPMLERIEPFLYTTPFAMIVIKISCYIEQINFGIPVSWGIRVYNDSPPDLKYDKIENLRIFPYNIFILILCAIAGFLVVKYKKENKPFQHIPLLFYGSTFFLDFFLGRSIGYIGPEFLKINPISVCHFIMLLAGIYLYILIRRDEKARGVPHAQWRIVGIIKDAANNIARQKEQKNSKASNAASKKNTKNSKTNNAAKKKKKKKKKR